jgi:hypothetical protein
VPGDGGIDQLAPVRRQRSQRAALVDAHQPAEAGNVGHQDDAEPPNVPLRRHVRYRATNVQ